MPPTPQKKKEQEKKAEDAHRQCLRFSGMKLVTAPHVLLVKGSLRLAGDTSTRSSARQLGSEGREKRAVRVGDGAVAERQLDLVEDALLLPAPHPRQRDFQ
eukprot:928460-Rhodomonas_salina.1